MNEFYGKFIEKIKRAENVYSFKFKTDSHIKFIPGQFVRVIFDRNDKNNKSLNKYLSFSNAFGKEYIEVTKKLSESDFSNSLKNLKLNDEILFEGPKGTCTLKNEYKKVAFLAGGIGITPVMSIIEGIMINKADIDVILLYGNWDEKNIAFKDVLDSYEKENKSIKVVHVLNSFESENADYVKGFITKDVIKEKIPDYNERHIYIFGPPKMVSCVKSECDLIPLEKEKLKIENFTGY